MSVVNTNMLSLRAQTGVSQSGLGIARSMERLSTGLAINSASDNAAGMAISHRMESQIMGLSQALRNVMDGVSLVQTAEGAMGELSAITQRLRELSVQALNDTLTIQDRQYLDVEFQALKKQMGTLIDQTRWNNGPLLNPRQKVLDQITPAQIGSPWPIDTSAPATGTYSLFINGHEVPVSLVQHEAAAVRLDKLINAMASTVSQHGVSARINTAGGLDLYTPDGRDLSVWYDSAVPGLKGVHLGLGANAIAQRAELSIAENRGDYPTLLQGPGYVEFAGYGGAGETLVWPAVAVPDNTAGAFSMINGLLYKGDGTRAVAVGAVDAVRNGTQGQPLRIIFKSEFVNASFESAGSSPSDIPGWTTYTQRVELNGGSTIEGFPTPTDNIPAPRGNGETVNFSGGQAQATLSSQFKSSGNTSLMLATGAVTIDPYAVAHGPAVASQAPSAIQAGETISFDWQAKGGADDFDVYAYLLNVENGNTLELLNRTGELTDWATQTVTVPVSGLYKFVFIAGTFDATGRRAAGATLYIDNVRIGAGNAAFVASEADVAALASRVVYTDTTPFSVSATINGTTVTSANASNINQALDSLQQAISLRIQDGTLPTLGVSRSGDTLQLFSSEPGQPFTLDALSSNSAIRSLQGRETVANQVQSDVIDAIAGANAQSTGAQVWKGTQASQEDLDRAGFLRIHLGANQGQHLVMELPDYGTPGGALDALLWDTNEAQLELAQSRSRLSGQALASADGLAVVNIRTAEAASNALRVADSTLQRIDSDRARLGAVVNRLQAAGDNLAQMQLEQSASRSTILDTDYAATSSELLRQQIVQQASTSVLAQANAHPRMVLQLLERN